MLGINLLKGHSLWIFGVEWNIYISLLIQTTGLGFTISYLESSTNTVNIKIWYKIEDGMLVISQLLGVMFAHHKAVFYLYVYEVAYGQFKDKMSVYTYSA